MRVKVDGKTYCVETLIYDNQRLRKEVIASGELRRLELENIKAEIKEVADSIPALGNTKEGWHNSGHRTGLEQAVDIIDKHIGSDANKVSKESENI